jgi:hypothetical protein
MNTRLAFIFAAVLLAWAAACPGALGQSFPEPASGQFSDADLEKARLEAAIVPDVPPSAWEGQPSPDAYTPLRPYPPHDDNATHYARGKSLIIHIFVNHTGGTWSASEKAAAAAKARVAKEFYVPNAPFGANVTFDHEGDPNGYHYFDVTLNRLIPEDGFNYGMINEALGLLGFSDWDGDGAIVDEFTFFLQNWNGGFDNVLSVWEPKQTGRSWAAPPGLSYCILYTNTAGNVFAHEWGHLYGACDEYEELGHCNTTVDCGACGGWYLHEVPNNSNCELPQCPSNIDCIMKHNQFTICPWTRSMWAWDDDDGDGMLDDVKRYLGGTSFLWIWEVPYNGWFYWNNVTDGMVCSQRDHSWAAFGLRSPAGADYDMTLFGDNNHTYPYASSAYGAGAIDFVVGDYNHCNIGNEHISLVHYSGNWDYYNLTSESGTEMLFPDGQYRVENWQDYNVVRVWDVPLFAGEELNFVLGVQSGAIDVGMALFRSNGASYYAGRSSAQWVVDAAGVGGTEVATYTAPADDVYGLVVFANTSAGGSIGIQIGPNPQTLTEGAPYYSTYPLKLYNYDVGAPYWGFVGTRPEPGTGVRVGLYEDATYETCWGNASDGGVGAIECFAVDYNHLAYGRDYLRVSRDAGAGSHRTEWEQGPDVISGALTAMYWDPLLIGEAWDALLQGGQAHFLREYHDFQTPLDTGLYVFASNDGDYHKTRSGAAAASDSHPAGDGGEWLTFTPASTDWYGIFQLVNNEGSGSYALWLGAKVDMLDGVKQTRPEEVVWGSAAVSSNYWTIFAARPGPGDRASIWLYRDEAYTSTSMAATDQSGGAVVYVVGDFNHDPLGTMYPRFRREAGTGSVDIEWEGGSETLSFSPGGTNVYDFTWSAEKVAEMFDLLIQPLGSGYDVGFEVSDQSGAMDFGIAFFASNGAVYYADPPSAVARADAAGIGGTETFTVHLVDPDWYGFAVYNKTDAGGGYRIRVIDEAGGAVPEGATAVLFDLQGVNPFKDRTALTLSLSDGGPADLVVFDTNGQRIRTLWNGVLPAGIHSVVWDGADEQGAPVASGVYFARLRAGGQETRMKLIRAR